MQEGDVFPVFMIFINFISLHRPAASILDSDKAAEYLSIMYTVLMILLNCAPRQNLEPIRSRIASKWPPENAAWTGRDVFSSFAEHRQEFWLLTSETPETFQELLPLVKRRFYTDIRHRDGTLSPGNRLLLTLIWLRHYPTYETLSLLFKVPKTSVFRIVHKTWIAMWQYFREKNMWHNRHEWLQLRGTWPEMPNVVGAIDGTSHRIYMPKRNQQLYYSGHRKCHCLHTQIVIDNRKNIVLVQSGFLGHENDATTYHHLPSVGPGMELNFPRNTRLLADSIYPCRYPLITPYKNISIRNQGVHEQRKRRAINLKIRARRVYVEHVIKDLKTFRVIGKVYRHNRRHLAALVELCAGLAQRKADLLLTL